MCSRVIRVATRTSSGCPGPLRDCGWIGADADAQLGGRLCVTGDGTGTGGAKGGVSLNLQRISAVALKEWKETTRDRLFLLLAFLLPALWLVVFGYGLNLDVENIPFAVLDRDRSELSRDYLHRFMQSRYLSFQGMPMMNVPLIAC